MPDITSQCKLLDEFQLDELFVEHLGWDRHSTSLAVPLDGHQYELKAVAQKRGFSAFVCEPDRRGRIPDHATRAKIDTQVTKSAREHLIIFVNVDRSEQIWLWVRRAPGQPIARREYPYRRGQRSGMLIERVLPGITFELAEEERLSLVEVTTRARAGFDVEKVTKRFYDRFKTEHEAFAKFLKGIPDESLQSWYVSVMLNRLMFIYFIQKKRFLNDDADYLRRKLDETRAVGKDRYYRDFLCPLFFEGFAKQPQDRSKKVNTLLGQVPFLNGGLFLRHQIEEQHGQSIQIPDAAFERLFEFFDGYRWHLDERPLRENNEINPDVLGYIFEKYINQKQMGAYYTKEDITGYISQSTVIPFLFDAARKECAIAFKPDSAVWRLLRDDPDQYIYEAVRRGVIDDAGKVIPESALPDFVGEGMHDPKKRMFDKRYNLGHAEIPGSDGRNLALPTETWREYIARRQRCLELREKLRKGEVHEINDLITLNLDIRQFAEDVIATSEGPELIRAFWKAIAGSAGPTGVTVLDPTCGSGAFLFAALNILEPLYEACLNRMEGLLEDLKRAGGKHHPEKFSDFRKVLDRIAQHPNHRYFVLKSIIVNNLFGVDIMEEATEICKLRLFLKLVAQIERFDDIEPLPDIDFNIRAGNTLVGFATLDEVKKSIEGRFDFGKDIERIEEQARLADTAFRKFREMQTDQGVTPAELAKGKEMVRSRMSALESELDGYLAGEYGIPPDKPKALAAWKRSHEPFHWFVDFYGIMSGGFDVIIGNPPYVEYSKVRRDYQLRGFATESAGNLYAMCSERAMRLLDTMGRFGFIVQAPVISTQRMLVLRDTLYAETDYLAVSSYDDRPSKLFDGMHHCRLAILLARRNPSVPQRAVLTTRYHKWSEIERPHLFQSLTYCPVPREACRAYVPKLRSATELSILSRLQTLKAQMGDFLSPSDTPHRIYYKITGVGHWFTFTIRPPRFWRGEQEGSSTRESYVCFPSRAHRDTAFCLLWSSLHYWFYQLRTNCRDFNPSDLASIPLANRLCDGFKESAVLSKALLKRLEATADIAEATYRVGGTVRFEKFSPRSAKDEIDAVDHALAPHYGLTPDEVDFIVNYDIKYRMAGSDDAQDD